MPVKLSHSIKGFTLIEILLAVSIMGILAGVLLTVINPSQLQGKARDAKRASSLKSIQTALELYRTNNSGSFPSSGGSWITVTGSDSLSTALSPASGLKYLQYMPQDPSYSSSSANSPCNYTNGANPHYRFSYNSNGSYFVLTAQMESVSSTSGGKCISLSNWNSYAGTCDNTHCYGLESRGN